MYKTPGKTLRLSFAMGGGVSLGSFSGAALTEILKLLVLYGRDRNGETYEKVILDSMSGSSAGAISLAILMRSLLDHQSTLLAITKNWERKEGCTFEKRKKPIDLAKCQPEEKEKFLIPLRECIEDRLRAYEDYPDQISTHRIQQLQAIETAQLLQELLWVEEVNMQELFQGTEVPGDNAVLSTRPTFSLLKNSKLIQLAREYLLPSPELPISSKQVQVLDERVLFACSLTNLLPFRLNESFEISGTEINLKERLKDSLHLVQETQKALSSKTHKELRILDFRFKTSDKLREENLQAESNWIKICPSDDADTSPFTGFNHWPPFAKSLKESSLSLEAKESWALFAASAIACGSFPIAFPPGILRRWKEEFYPFGQQEKREDGNPKFGKDQNIWDLGLNSYKFPYLDGGTLNNEPIREAFKLANYLDTKRRKINPAHTFDRLVLFVDPIVDASNSPSYTVEAYDPNRLRDVKPSWRFWETALSLQKRNVFSKALSLSGMVVGLLRNQGSVKEEYKINNYLETLQLKKTLENHLSNLPVQFTGESDEIDLICAIITHVRDSLKRNYIPYGTRDIAEYFLWAISDQLDKEDSLSKTAIEQEQEEYLQFFFQSSTSESPHFNQKKYEATIHKIEEFILEIEKPEASSTSLEALFDQTLFSHTSPENPSTEEEETYEFIPSFFDHLEEYVEFTPDKAPEKEETLEDPKYLLKRVIKKAFLNIMIDAALDLDGKDSKAERLSVTPLAFAGADSGSEVRTIDLPGSELEAFGGFASQKTRAYSFQYGRYCALKVLSRQDFRVFYKSLFPDQPSKAQSFISESKIGGYLEKMEDDLDTLHEDIQKSYEKNVKQDLFDLIETRLLTLFPRKRAPFLSLLIRRANKQVSFNLIVVTTVTLMLLGILALLISIGQTEYFKSWFPIITMGSIVILGALLVIVLLGIRKLVHTPLQGLEQWMVNTISNIPAKEITIQLKLPKPQKLKSYCLELEGKTLHVTCKSKSQAEQYPAVKAFWYKPEHSDQAAFYILGEKKLPKSWEGHPKNMFSEDPVRLDKLKQVQSITFPAKNTLLRRMLGITKSQEETDLFPPIFLDNLLHIHINQAQGELPFLDHLDFFVRPVVVCELVEDLQNNSRRWVFGWEDQTSTLEDMILGTTSPAHPPQETELS